MKYRKSAPITREQADHIVLLGEPKAICAALFDAINSISDRSWNEKFCLSLLSHFDEEVRAAAITCLGELARLHGKIDLDLVLPAFRTIWIREEKMRGLITDAVDNFNIFAGANIDGYKENE
jgi:hypothetical protein